jgi:Uma2 family endonuclease
MRSQRSSDVAIVTDWTLEQFLRLPEAKPALEYECGTVSQKVSPTTEHALLQVRIARLLDDLGSGRAFTELRVLLVPEASKVPDVAFYVNDELPRGPHGRWLRYPEWAPSVAVEIASPDQDLDELRAKCRFYRAHGSAVALLVLPETETVEVFTAAADPATVTGDEPLSDELAITPAQIFAALHAQ